MAAQFSDLYGRVDGLNLHEIAMNLAHGRDPAQIRPMPAAAACASSYVFRSFPGRRALSAPQRHQRALLASAYPDAVLMSYPRSASDVIRDHKWLGSSRHGILNLGGADPQDLSAAAKWPATCWAGPSAAPHRLDSASGDGLVGALSCWAG